MRTPIEIVEMPLDQKWFQSNSCLVHPHTNPHHSFPRLLFDSLPTSTSEKKKRNFTQLIGDEKICFTLQSLFWSVFLHAVGEWTRKVRRKDSFKDAYTFYLSDLQLQAWNGFLTRAKIAVPLHNMQQTHQLRNWTVLQHLRNSKITKTKVMCFKSLHHWKLSVQRWEGKHWLLITVQYKLVPSMRIHIWSAQSSKSLDRRASPLSLKKRLRKRA